MQQARSNSAVWLLSVVFAVGAGLVSLRMPAPSSAVSSPAKPLSTPTARAAPTLVSDVAAVLGSEDLAAAMRKFRSSDGASLISPQVLRTLVDQSCRVPALLRMDGRDQPDWRRDQFRRELEQRCQYWAVPSMFVAQYGADFFINETVMEQSAVEALSELRLAADPDALRRAWWNAYRIDALPQTEIFADQRRLLPAEAQQLIEVVIDWRQCARYRSCGPASLLTLRVCAMHGCAGGEDLLAAWHQALSPRDFESALAMSSWLPIWPAIDD